MMPLNFMVLRLRSLLRQDLLMVMVRLLLSQEMRLRMPSMLSFLHQKPRKGWEDCYFNVIGQVIDANAPFAHLSGYNFMTAQTTASGTEISEISFKHKIAVLKFEVTLPDGIVPKYITLSTQMMPV